MIVIKLISKILDKFYVCSSFMKLINYNLLAFFMKELTILIFNQTLNLAQSFNSMFDTLLFGLVKGYKCYLKLRGAGYKFRLIKTAYYFGLIIRVGYSHLIFINLGSNFRIKFLSKLILLFYSNDLWFLKNKIQSIKLKKQVNVYKEKGILYKNFVYVLKKSSKLKF